MRLAAVLPNTAIGHDSAMIRDWAQAAEGLGFDRIVAEDHVLGAERDREVPLTGPYSETHPFREPLTLFSYFAGITRSVELMTGVLILPQRQTALVAKQAAEVDLLSSGRLVLGLGTGWNYVEYESLGTQFSSRGARLEEQVQVLRRLWTEPVLDFDGRFHRIDRAGILPRPGREIPIWFGGASERAIRRAARMGDGFLFAAMRPSTYEGVALLKSLLAQRPDGQAGRERPFGLQVMVSALSEPAQIEDHVRRWADLGGTDLAISTSPAFTGLGTRGADLDCLVSRLAESAEIARSAAAG
jgi:probable F420-dependent oxidoreductase